MNRRQFLASLGIGAPAAVVAAKFGLAERVRNYFFAPAGGWTKSGDLYLPHYPCNAQMIALQIEVYAKTITDFMQRDSMLFDKIERRTEAHRAIVQRRFFEAPLLCKVPPSFGGRLASL